MVPRRVQVHSPQNPRPQPRHARIQQRDAFLLRKGPEINDHLRKAIQQPTAQTWNERVAPDIVIECQNDVQAVHGMPQRCQKCRQPERSGLIAGKALQVICHQHNTHLQGQEPKQRLQALHAHTHLSRLRQAAHSPGIFRHRSRETEKHIHPERHLTQRQAASVCELQTQALSKNIEIFTRPMRRHRTRVMKIKGFHWFRAQGKQRALAVLARDLTRRNQRLKRRREHPANHQIQGRQTARGRQTPRQTPQNIFRDRRSIHPTVQAGSQRDEFMGLREVMLGAGNQVRFPIPRTRRTQQNAPPRLLGRNLQHLA